MIFLIVLIVIILWAVHMNADARMERRIQRQAKQRLRAERQRQRESKDNG